MSATPTVQPADRFGIGQFDAGQFDAGQFGAGQFGVEQAGVSQYVQFIRSVAPTARWSRRVVASLIDSVIYVALMTFVFGEEIWAEMSAPIEAQVDMPVDPLGVRVLFGYIAVVWIMQAFVGSSPGKLVMGVVIVGSSSWRPVGLIRILLRHFAHIIDEVLLIGYLRPLWNANRQTFADSLLGTVALHTRRPLAHKWLRRLTGESGHSAIPVYNEAPRRSIGRLVLTLVACALAVAAVGYLVMTYAL